MEAPQETTPEARATGFGLRFKLPDYLIDLHKSLKDVTRTRNGAHESPRTTKLYDRTNERLTQDEVERNSIIVRRTKCKPINQSRV